MGSMSACSTNVWICRLRDRPGATDPGSAGVRPRLVDLREGCLRVVAPAGRVARRRGPAFTMSLVDGPRVPFQRLGRAGVEASERGGGRHVTPWKSPAAPAFPTPCGD